MYKTVLIFDWRKLIQDQLSRTAHEVGIFYHETDCWHDRKMADFPVYRDSGTRLWNKNSNWLKSTVWQIGHLCGNNWDTMQKGLSDYSNNERQWHKIDGLNRWKWQEQQIAVPSTVHELWFLVKFRSMIVYGCPNEAIMIITEHTVLIFMWWKLIKNQHSWPADEIAISCHEWLLEIDMIWLKDRMI